MEQNYKTIKRIDIVSLAKTIFFLDLVLMLVFMVPFSLIVGLMPQKEGAPPIWIMPLVLIFFHPLACAAASAMAAVFYNFIAPKTGGIKVVME